MTAGAPPPEANTRSKPRSSSRAARRKSSTTLTMPRRITTSLISSATHASICSSLWSARRARYSVGSADRPVEATVPPASVGRRKYARRLPCGGTGGSGQRRPPRSLGPVVEPLRQPSADPTGPPDVGRVCDERRERGGQTVCRVGERRAVGTSFEGYRLAHRNADVPAEAEPARPVDGDRHQRHTRAHREVGGPLAQPQGLVLPSVDPALACDGDDASARDNGADSPCGLEEVVLPGLVRDRGPGPCHDPVPPPDRHVLFLGAEEPQPGPVGQERHQDERVRPAHVVETVDGRPGRERPSIGATDPQVAPGQDGDDDSRDPVAQGPPPGADVRAGKGASGGFWHVDLQAIASGSRSASRSTTRSASSSVPAAGGTLTFGTRTTVIPAAFAARTPLCESSTTRQEAGSHPSRMAVSR